MKTQQGSAHIILIIGLIVALMGAIGYTFWRNMTAESAKVETKTSIKTAEKKSEVVKEVDTTIYDVSIELKTEADLAKLPDYTPSSFRSYLAEKLRNNKPFDNGEAMVMETWKINKISQANIQGGQVPTDEAGNGYAGGAPSVWVLTPSGMWDRQSLNDPVCLSENGGKIYEEFVPTCYDDTHPNGIKNTNGSIKTIAN